MHRKKVARGIKMCYLPRWNPNRRQHMNAPTDQLTEGMVTSFGRWVKDVVAEAATVCDEQGARELEQRIVGEGQRLLLKVLRGGVPVGGRPPAGGSDVPHVQRASPSQGSA